MRICTKCSIAQLESEFYKLGGNQSGYRGDCKTCVRKRTNKRGKETGWTKKVPCSCGNLKAIRATFCGNCSRRQSRPRKRTGSLTKSGYVVIAGQREHRTIMSESLGRPLLRSENVHHKNGIRHDNRIENLELWTKSQPCGQRVTDKIDWAIEFLQLYAPEVLK